MTDISQYVKPVITVRDLLPILTELDKSMQLKAVQSYPSLIAMLKTVLKHEYIEKCDELDIELVTEIMNYANQKIPFKKIVQVLNGEQVDINQDTVNRFCKDKIKIKDLKVFLEQLDKQMQTNITNLYLTVIAMLKIALREDINVAPEDLDVNDAVEILAYAMQKIQFNKIQQLFGFLT
jgi:DNA-binding protein